MNYEQFEEITPPFRKLLKKHRRLGVSWYLQCHDDENCVGFWSFTRRTWSSQLPDPRFKGLGKACLEDIVSLADELGIAIWLYCNVPKLFPMYESVGFVCIREERYEEEPDYVKREYKRQPRRDDDARDRS